MSHLPTAEELQQLLDYDPETGVLTWKARTGKHAATFNSTRAGKPAGTLRRDGYVAMKVKNVIYAAHRVIWALVHDEWPECIRHVNRNDADNRLQNLRGMTRAEICQETIRAKELRAPLLNR